MAGTDNPIARGHCIARDLLIFFIALASGLYFMSLVDGLFLIEFLAALGGGVVGIYVLIIYEAVRSSSKGHLFFKRVEPFVRVLGRDDLSERLTRIIDEADEAFCALGMTYEGMVRESGIVPHASSIMARWISDDRRTVGVIAVDVTLGPSGKARLDWHEFFGGMLQDGKRLVVHNHTGALGDRVSDTRVFHKYVMANTIAGLWAVYRGLCEHHGYDLQELPDTWWDWWYEDGVELFNELIDKQFSWIGWMPLWLKKIVLPVAIRAILLVVYALMATIVPALIFMAINARDTRRRLAVIGLSMRDVRNRSTSSNGENHSNE